ncbi:TVP38/TMEM64 family protein [Facklamia sp. P12945]|uniref:TVP38/TMEM64 family protein n=1 Tax=unclassified Facklamia TaxID=2622293 RepID=UPI003D181819
MDEKRQILTRKWMHFLNILGLIVTLILVMWGIQAGVFTDERKMLVMIKGFGFWAPLIFIIIQIAQTIIPVMPGAITIPIGILAFGPFWGFVLNLLPIYLGSWVNFWIGRRYGKPTVRAILGDKSYGKMIRLYERKNMGNWLFTFLMFFPFSPADILCYGAGITTMTRKYFILSLLFGKPVSLACYGFGTTYILHWLTSFF